MQRWTLLIELHSIRAQLVRNIHACTIVWSLSPGLEKMFISLQASQNFYPVWSNFPSVGHIFPLCISFFSFFFSQNRNISLQGPRSFLIFLFFFQACLSWILWQYFCKHGIFLSAEVHPHHKACINLEWHPLPIRWQEWICLEECNHNRYFNLDVESSRTNSFSNIFLTIFKNFRNITFCVHNRNQHEKCIRMSTNRPMFGLMVLETTCDIFTN